MSYSQENPKLDKCNDSLDAANDDIKDRDDKGWDDEHLVAFLYCEDDKDISSHITDTPNSCPDSIS